MVKDSKVFEPILCYANFEITSHWLMWNPLYPICVVSVNCSLGFCVSALKPFHDGAVKSSQFVEIWQRD